MSSQEQPVAPGFVTAYEIAPSPVVEAATGVTVAAGMVSAVVGDQDIVGVANEIVTVDT